MNGKPGNHPITDLMVHRIGVYGDPLDSELRELGELMSYQRLCDWFEQYWSAPAEHLQPSVGAKLEECDARERVWDSVR
jgi:hypothetical protein